MSRPNIVLDTNSLVQVIPPRSPYHRIYVALMSGRYSLCVTTEILEEYEEVLTRLTRPSTARAVVEAIVENPYTKQITSYYRFQLITADPDDNKFVDCAVAASARCIVTEDRHFDVLRRVDFPRVDVVGLDDFLSMI